MKSKKQHDLKETVTYIGPAFVDDRGEITNVFEGKVEHIALITSKQGSVRANHVHKHLHQYIYLVSGEMETYSCDPQKDPTKVQILRVCPGDLINTPPTIAHAQKMLKDSVFIALSTRKRSKGQYEDDTLAYEVIKNGYINAELKKAS